jgi:hypothetical protein
MAEGRFRRHVVEGTVIVGSILLAFGLDASWDNWLERRETRELLVSIREDLDANRTVVADEIESSRRVVALAKHLLEALSVASSASEAPFATLGNIFSWKAWDPVNDTYLEARSSGRLALIDNSTVRLELARYQRRIEAVELIAEATRDQYYGLIEPFFVARTTYSDVASEAWREGLGLARAPHATNFAALGASRELWNLLTLRLELELAWESYLLRLDAQAEALQEALEDELSR